MRCASGAAEGAAGSFASTDDSTPDAFFANSGWGDCICAALPLTGAAGAGALAGASSGQVITNDGMPAFELSATIDMQLEQTMDGELLRIADGRFVSAAAVAIPAWSDIVGELDCSRGRFEGDLSADYDATAGALHDGAWDMVGNLDGFPGSCEGGTWSATRVP